MWKEIPPFSFPAGERKIMAHFVVFPSSLTAFCPDINLRQGSRAQHNDLKHTMGDPSVPWSSVIRYDKLRQVTTSTRLLNHLIRLDQHALWYHEAKLVCGLQIDENLEFFRQPDLQITGFCTLQDLHNITGGAPE